MGSLLEINVETIAKYSQILEDSFLISKLHRTKSLSKVSDSGSSSADKIKKYYVTDLSLVQQTKNSLGDLTLNQFEYLFENFIVNELRSLCDYSQDKYNVYYSRWQDRLRKIKHFQR